MRVYNRVVLWSVRHKYVTLVVGLGAVRRVDPVDEPAAGGLLPKEDAARTLMVVELPPGARLDDTIAVTDRIAQRNPHPAGGPLRLRRRPAASCRARRRCGSPPSPST